MKDNKITSEDVNFPDNVPEVFVRHFKSIYRSRNSSIPPSYNSEQL